MRSPGMTVEWRLPRMPEASAVIARSQCRKLGFELGHAMREAMCYRHAGRVARTSYCIGVLRVKCPLDKERT